MKHLLIILSILLLSSPLFGNNHKGETLYLWRTSSGDIWKGFGEKETHSVYKGDVENGKPNGVGIFTDLKNGYKYVGEWKNGEWDGQGNAKFPSGDMYDGLFDDGWLIKGTMYFSDGREYVGENREWEYWNGIMYDKNGKIYFKVVNGKIGRRYPSTKSIQRNELS